MRGSGIILLVEDNPDDVELTLRAFKMAGLANRIEVARDGVEAVEYLYGPASSPADPPSLILLDLKLPRMDGLEVLKRIRSEASTKIVPVVVLTSSKEDRDLRDCYSLGANSFVRKPVDFNEFQDAARKLGFYWLLLNEGPPEAP